MIGFVKHGNIKQPLQDCVHRQNVPGSRLKLRHTSKACTKDTKIIMGHPTLLNTGSVVVPVLTACSRWFAFDEQHSDHCKQYGPKSATSNQQTYDPRPAMSLPPQAGAQGQCYGEASTWQAQPGRAAVSACCWCRVTLSAAHHDKINFMRAVLCKLDQHR